MGINNVDYSTLTVAGTAIALASGASPVMPSQAKGALITVETDQVRYRDDGTAPTGSVGGGTLLNVGDVLTYDSWTNGVNWRQVLNALQFIRVTNTATLSIHWYD